MHPNYVSCKISVVEYSYIEVIIENLIIDRITSTYMNFYELMSIYESKNYEKLKQTV
jgi:hypothetical protein